MHKNILCCLLLAAVPAQAELSELNETELQETSGQSGITLSARVEFDEGTRISYTNDDADYLDGQDYWLIIDNLTGAIEMKGLRLDLVSDFGPSGNEGALQWTLPDEIIFDELKTDGIYMSSGRETDSSSRFLLGVEVDGSLQFPASTTMSIFATD